MKEPDEDQASIYEGSRELLDRCLVGFKLALGFQVEPVTAAWHQGTVLMSVCANSEAVARIGTSKYFAHA